MVVLPLFWDQYDNAQRMHELGFGVRLATYDFADEELIAAVDGLRGGRDAPIEPGRARRADPACRRRHPARPT